MNKEFVPYELALALKELGFDEKCLSAFFDDKIKRCDYVQNSKSKWISAPTFSQAFRWFRENYSLNNFIYHYKKVDVINFAYNINDNIFKSDFNTYEGSKLECLKKLIEIVKEKK